MFAVRPLLSVPARLGNWKMDGHCHLLVYSGTDAKILFFPSVNVGKFNFLSLNFLIRKMEIIVVVHAYWGYCKD